MLISGHPTLGLDSHNDGVQTDFNVAVRLGTNGESGCVAGEIVEIPDWAELPFSSSSSTLLVARQMAKKDSRAVNRGSTSRSASAVKLSVKKETVKEEKVKNVRDASDNEKEDIDRGSGLEGNGNGTENAEVDELAGDQDECEGSPKGHKRVRVDADGHSAPGAGDEGEAEAKVRTVTLPRDDDGYAFFSLHYTSRVYTLLSPGSSRVR